MSFFKPKERPSKFYPVKDDSGKLVWQNLFYMPVQNLIFLVLILYLAWAYMHETDACKAIVERPCTYCRDANCCDVLASDSLKSEFDVPDFGIEPVFDSGG